MGACQFFHHRVKTQLMMSGWLERKNGAKHIFAISVY